MDLFSTFVDSVSTNLDSEYPHVLYGSPMNLGKRIEQRLRELGWRQVDLLDRVPEMGAGTLNATIKRDAKKSDFAAAIAKALRVRLEWLQTGADPKEDVVESRGFFVSANPSPQIGTPIIEWEKPEDLPEGEFVIVPRFDIHVACGNGHVVYEEMPMEQGAAFRSDWVKREGLYLRNLATVRATGDSMEPSIYPGDALLVDRAQTQVQDGRVFLLRFGYEVRVKRLFKRADGGLRIVSDNGGKYPEEVVTAAEMEHIEIIGRVVHKSGAM